MAFVSIGASLSVFISRTKVAVSAAILKDIAGHNG